jgi:Tol biopolymer transport system component
MVSSDGLTLWFSSDRVAGQGSHIYVATRASTLAAFTGASLAATVNAADPTVSDIQPFVTADSGELWFSSTRTPTQGSRDIWYARRTAGGLAAPATDTALNSASFDGVPTLSADRLTVFFDSNRTGTGVKGGFDIWIAHRATADGAFSAPTLVAEVNTTGNDVAGWISDDSCRLYLRNDSSSTTQIFVATRQP